MVQHIAHFTLLVRDYDEAIEFYTRKLGFELLEDTDLGGGKRWVRVCPARGARAEPPREAAAQSRNEAGDRRAAGILLARAATPEQAARIGGQTGGRVAVFIHTDDFWRDYAALAARGVVFRRAPREEPYGTVAVFADLYGNLFDLIEPRQQPERGAPGRLSAD